MSGLVLCLVGGSLREVIMSFGVFMQLLSVTIPTAVYLASLVGSVFICQDMCLIFYLYCLLHMPMFCFTVWWPIFVAGGTDGLFAQKTLEITDEVLATYKNQGVLKLIPIVLSSLTTKFTIHFLMCTSFSFEGGYDLLGRTKDQIRTTEQVNAALATCQNLKLDGLVIIGGFIIDL